MLRWKKLLAATDFSPTAEVALRSAETLARESGAILVVTHVVQPLPPTYSIHFTGAGPSDLEAGLEREARDTLRRVVAGVQKRYSRVRGILRVGKPWSEILGLAEGEQVDAICLGNSGHSAFARLLLGSTAENVVRRSRVPVLVTRDRAIGQVRRILVPVDFDPASKAALEFARDGFPEGTELRAVHVSVPIAPFDPAIGVILPGVEDLAGELRAFLGKRAVERAAPEIRTQSDVVAGILAGASEHDVDLIVIATHGRRGLARALLGSVAEKVVRHADRPVLILPGPGRGWTWKDRGPGARTKKVKAAERSSGPPPAMKPRTVSRGRKGRGPWTGQAHTGRGGPAGRRGAGSSAGKHKGGKKP